jgi:hypothetical protein
LRENPAETEVVSHQLLLRAGCIRQLAGISTTAVDRSAGELGQLPEHRDRALAR